MSTFDEPSEFYRRVAFYRYHDEFQVGERDYKIRLASMLAKGRAGLISHPSESLLYLRRALQSPDNNIINWRLQKRLFDWFEHRPANSITSLQALWNEENDLAERFDGFAHALVEAGFEQPGAQLVVGSTFLMALSPFHFPPVRMEAFRAAMELAGHATLYTLKSAVERYLLAQSFMDGMIEESKRHGIDLRDRLDSQGVIWCVADGWPAFPIPPDWQDDPAQRKTAEQLYYAVELKELASEPGGSELTVTERQALVQARRGQGKFREQLLSLWISCAVSECGHVALLRASHIRPWKASNNYERLDRYNGFLLAPNLDAAFDKGLVTFEDDGRILISASLNSADRKALAIRGDFRLRMISPNHLPYLRYHREYVFKKNKTTDNA
jgi:hypothetical protein